ncbi:uncharacterized protein CBL_10130 [Carabus blaptoides fortunei]
MASDRNEQILEHNDESKDEPVSFERAVSETGFGKFNYKLIVMSFLGACAVGFNSLTMSYVSPKAQCDLSLNLMDQGMLNASSIAGKMTSMLLWGVFANLLGRRLTLVYGCLISTLIDVVTMFANDLWTIASLRFLSGFMISGPYSCLMVYLSEFHSSKYRSHVVTLYGIGFGGANTLLPLLAWLILPLNNITIESYVIYSWQLFIGVCTLPNLACGLMCITLPESPKFLMTFGKNQEALDVFRTMYFTNTGHSTYPISQLEKEFVTNNSQVSNTKSVTHAIKEGWYQIKPIFFRCQLWKMILVIVMQFNMLLGTYAMKFWTPQLFISMDKYRQDHNYTDDATLCDMISYSFNKTEPEFSNITTVVTEVYLSNITSTCETVSNHTVIVNLLVSITVDLFPTTVRAMAVSLSLMFGRSGSVVGSIVFPILLVLGCLPPVLLLGGVVFICLLLVFMLPRVKDEDFE